MNEHEADTRRFRATVHYHGARFHGSQLQPAVATVQGALEAALERLETVPRRVQLAGRTDAGVHAVGQEIAFDVRPVWEATDLRRALNAVLGAGVWVERLSAAPDAFHPRFDAVARRYEYRIATGADAESPLRTGSVWPVVAPMDESSLTEIASWIPGERSFERFAKRDPDRSTRCRVDRAAWGRAGSELVFEVAADRFLHHMVRYLVGTAVEVALGRRPLEDYRRLLDDESASRAAFPAPASGLYLTGVRYAEGWNRAPGVPGRQRPDTWTGDAGTEQRRTSGTDRTRGDPEDREQA